MSKFDPACRVKINADGDWQILPPAGQFTRVGQTIGDFLVPGTNDDILVAGRLMAYGRIACGDMILSEFLSESVGAGGFALIGNEYDESAEIRMRTEEITIPIGGGIAGVSSATGMFQLNSISLMTYARVTQAPGGGATTFTVYRMLFPADELISGSPVAVNTVANSCVDSDGTHDGPFYNAVSDFLFVKTDANVTVSDMKVRVGVLYMQHWNFDS